jgi:hypothetical protein
MLGTACRNATGISCGPLLRIGIQLLYEYEVHLPVEGSFLKADLTRDTTADLAKSE